jgi:octaprenyl-diphosphate synthase
MQSVDHIIRQSLHSDVALIGQVAEHIIAAGGKRLRPVLVILSARALSYEGQQHYDLAAVIEFIHTATLLHDDVVDESSLRRGKPTSNSLFGNAASVLVGDFVYSRAFQMMVNVGDMKILQVLADATNVIAEGEVLQLMNCRNPQTTEQEYLKVIHCKTAKLFEAATRIGALLAKAPLTTVEAMSRYGAHLGLAFQLIDDVLDYSGDQALIGKSLGDDLAEGKPTLPLIHVMRHGNPIQVAAVQAAIRGGGLEELPLVLEAIHSTGALEYVREKAFVQVHLAKQELACLAPGRERDFLLQLADFSASRGF